MLYECNHKYTKKYLVDLKKKNVGCLVKFQLMVSNMKTEESIQKKLRSVIFCLLKILKLNHDLTLIVAHCVKLALHLQT